MRGRSQAFEAGSSSKKTKKFTSIPQVIMNTLAIALLPIMPAGGLFTLADGNGGVAAAMAGWIVPAAGVPLVVRSARMGVVVSDSAVTIRNVMRDRVIELSNVDRFDVAETPWWVRTPSQGVALLSRDGEEYSITVLGLPQFSFLRGPSLRRMATMNAELARRRGSRRSGIS
jgi:hypothetical protein